jgi:hypothetical protein
MAKTYSSKVSYHRLLENVFAVYLLTKTLKPKIEINNNLIKNSIPVEKNFENTENKSSPHRWRETEGEDFEAFKSALKPHPISFYTGEGLRKR